MQNYAALCSASAPCGVGAHSCTDPAGRKNKGILRGSVPARMPSVVVYLLLSLLGYFLNGL